MEGNRKGIPADLAERVIEAVIQSPDGISRTQLVRRFRTLSAAQIDDILIFGAVQLGRATVAVEPAVNDRGDRIPGRPTVRYRARPRHSQA
jgi:hypothetical protein